jgi:hypothetical protein
VNRSFAAAVLGRFRHPAQVIVAGFAAVTLAVAMVLGARVMFGYDAVVVSGPVDQVERFTELA